MGQLWRYKPEAFSHVRINLLSNLAAEHRAELSVMYTSFPLAVYLRMVVYIVSVCVWGGGEAHEGGNLCILTGDSQCRVAETDTTLQSDYSPIKTKFLKKWN